MLNVLWVLTNLFKVKWNASPAAKTSLQLWLEQWKNHIVLVMYQCYVNVWTSYDLRETHVALKQRNNICTPFVGCWWFFTSLWMSPMLLALFPPPPSPLLTIVWRIWLTEVQWEVINSLSPLQRPLCVSGRLRRGIKESAWDCYFCWDTQRELRWRREINKCFTGSNS